MPNEERAWVEQLALALEDFQLPRMAGRVLGQLLVCDPPHQSLDALAEVLGASKASMSTTARLLARLGYVEQVPVPGQRRDHYGIREGAWLVPTRRHVESLTRLREVAERRLEPTQGGRGPVAELTDCCSSLEGAVSDALRRLGD